MSGAVGAGAYRAPASNRSSVMASRCSRLRSWIICSILVVRGVCFMIARELYEWTVF